MITRLGGGSFADVYKAKEKSTGELVAIKVLKRKYKKWEDCLELRECRSLQKLHEESLLNKPGEENIIKLKQIIFIKKTGTLNLVFEYMKTDLLELMKSREPQKLNEDQIRDIMHQTLLGLSFMHKYGFFHRDMKPENLLLTGNKLKIADFGLAREIRSVPPYTEYVSTRYYRAPECILQSTNYNSPIDIWGIGCIMAEMYLHPQPLFCGANEKEVLFRICSVLGTPTYDTWNDGIQQANIVGIKFPTNPGMDLEKIIPGASSEAIDLMKLMLKWDPNKRATAKMLLKHPFFSNHTINTYYYTERHNDILFGENNVKKFSNIKDSTNLFKMVDDLKNKDKLKENNNNINNNDILENNNFGLGDDDNNFGGMLNETDGFDKLLNELKQQKIEDEKNYEKEKEKEREKEKEKEKEKNKFKNVDYDINNLVDSYNNTKEKEENFTKRNKNDNDNIKNKNIFDDDFFGGKNTNSSNNNYEKKYSNLNSNTKKDINSENKELKPKFTLNINRRGNARQFLENTENNYNNEINNNKNNNTNNLLFNFSNDFGSISNTKTINENIGNNNNDYNNFNLGESGSFGSLFGMGSRRRHDKNYEI